MKPKFVELYKDIARRVVQLSAPSNSNFTVLKTVPEEDIFYYE